MAARADYGRAAEVAGLSTRRRFLQLGLGGLVGLATPGSLRAPAASGKGLLCLLPSAAAAEAGAAPLPEPFTVPFRVPAVAEPVRRDADTDYYEIQMRPADVELLPGLRTRIWGYDGQFPGPTIRAQVGRRVVVRQVNGLGTDTAIHLHGARVRAEDDGHPLDFIPPGGSRDYSYPNEQPGATLWYHDHAMHRTGEQVYRGLAGLYLLLDPDEERLGLPSGERDLPLVLADKTFAADGSLRYDAGQHMGFFGEVPLVNGAPRPRLEVAPALYRFRILNASNARPYELALEGSAALVQIGTDGGLLPDPVSRQSVTVWPAERVEVLIDFSGLTDGTRVVVRNRFAGPSDPGLVAFDVTGSVVSEPGSIPSGLRPLPELPPPVAVREVDLGFDEANQVWVLNGRGFDVDRVDYRPRLDTVERWRVHNNSHMAHPLHLHLVMFQVRSRQLTGSSSQPPENGERGWKDTVLVRPGETVEVDAQFSGGTGRYVYHCHILEHEDHDMMAQFAVVDLVRHAGTGRVETAAVVSAATFAPGVPVAFVATASGFADALAGGPAAAVEGGPVLLTAGPRLHPAAADELRRLRPGRIVVLGGPGAVPEAVVEDLRGYTDGQVTRVAGASRYATAAAVSSATFTAGTAVAYVATGDAFPDALGGGAAAAADGGPMLLVSRDTLPTETAAELQRLRPTLVVVLGGAGAVSGQVEAQLRNYAPQVQRLAGADRFDTCAQVVRRAFADPGRPVFVATGADYPDALAAVPAAAAAGAPLLLVTPEGVPPQIAVELRRLAPSRIVVLGGAGAVPAAVEEELAGYLE